MSNVKKSNSTKKRRAGRPRKEIEGNKVKLLAGYGMNNSEIAEFFGVNETTIRNNFSEFLTKGRAEQKNKLRRKQMQVAMKGNVIMLIWLGKQILGQIEKVETSADIAVKFTRSIKEFSSGNE
jgi:transposase